MFYIFSTENPNINISILDLFLVPLLIFAFVAFAKRSQKYKEMPLYLQQNFTNGLYIKLLSTIIFCLVHIFYYGGDTHMYFGEMLRLKNLAFINFGGFLDITFNGASKAARWYFNSEIGYPMGGMWRDPNTYFMARLLSLVTLFCFNSYLIASIFVSRIIYSGLWKLYTVFNEVHPDRSKVAAWAILFTPSVLFWGSGILKDSVCLAAVGFYTYGFYTLFLMKKIKFSSILYLIISAFILISIKPYIFVAILPGSMIWFSFKTLNKIKNPIFKTISFPAILGLTYLVFNLIFSSFSKDLGAYGSVDTMVQKAKITKDDHTRKENAYSENYYDIGEMDGTIDGALGKAPESVVAGLFRPFIWEARNPFIILSGFENLILLILTFRMFLKTGLFGTFKNIFNDPLLFFCFVFSIFFAYSVGLSVANFGALVRLRSPLIPFFVYLIVYLNKVGIKKTDEEDIVIVDEKKTMPFIVK